MKVAVHTPGAGFRRTLMTVMVAVAAGVALPLAQAMPGGPGGPGMGGYGMMGGPGSARMSHMLDHMLDGLGATDAQRTQIRQIAQTAAADMKAQHEAGRALRERGLQLLAAPTVDAAAAEVLRQQMVAQHDQGSKRMLQAMIEISAVLTPEQRVKFAEVMKQRGGMMQHRMGWPGAGMMQPRMGWGAGQKS